jgi:RNA polymerase sigma factor (sigma-70 family)
MGDGSVVADLVFRAQQGDQVAWSALIERFGPLVWSVCSRFGLPRDLAEEVGQNVWLSLIEKLSTLREPAALPGWLATTTRRECLHVAKAVRRRQQHERAHDDQEPPDPNEKDLADDLLRAERDDALRAAFDQLPAKCRDLLALLTAMPRLPYTEISRRLDIAVGSIGPNRQRCLDRLRQCPVLADWLRHSAERAVVGSAE